jgi:ABC-2 type transport system ATP-binding protein
VLAGGKVQLEGAPLDLIAQTKGRIWKRTIDRDELEEHQAKYQVISTRLFAGRTIIHVLADAKPAGFDDVEAGLEDVYFTTLADLRRAA